MNGLPFDDDATAWSAFMGFAATRYVGVELGYWDHGRFKSELFATPEQPSLAINEWYFGATLTYPLTQRLALTGGAGLSRAQFDVQGEVTVAVIGPPSSPGIPTLPFPVFPPGSGIIGFAPVQFATPKDETGGYWRVGLNWRFSDRVDAGLSYGRISGFIQ